MERNERHEAIILRSRNFGERNRGLTLLCPTVGLVDATLYGGPKNKLVSLAAPWHAGMAWLYAEPSRGGTESRHAEYPGYKLVDFDPSDTWPALSTSLRASLTAPLWAEILIRSRSGGSDYHEVHRLCLACLSALDASAAAGDERACRYVNLYFLDRLFSLFGYASELDACASCGAELLSGAFWSSRDDAYLCPVCAQAQPGSCIDVGRGWLTLLERYRRLGMADALASRLEPRAEAVGLGVSLRRARILCEGRLNSVEVGEGIL